MMEYKEFLFRKDDKVVCPSCKEEGIITEDVPISREKTLTILEYVVHIPELKIGVR